MEISVYHGTDTAERVILYSSSKEERKLCNVFAKRIKKGTVKMVIKDDKMFLISGPKEIQVRLTPEDKIFLENRLKLTKSKMQLNFGDQTKLTIDFT